MRAGIDIASYQHPNGAPIDYAAAVAGGVRWVCVKIDEGDRYVNPYAEQDLDGFRAAGATVAVYHFADPGVTSPRAAGDHFTRNIPAGFADADRVLDFERANGLSWAQLATWALEFQRYSGAQVLYVNRSWQHGLGLAGFSWPGRLWLAAPSERVFPVEAWAWQYGRGPVAGIGGTVDLDQIREADMTPDEVQAAASAALVAYFGDRGQFIADRFDTLAQQVAELSAKVDVLTHGTGGAGASNLVLRLEGTASPA